MIIFNEHLKAPIATEILSKFPKTVNPEKFLDELDTNPKLKEDKIKEKLFSVFVPSRAQKSLAGDDIYIEF